MKSVSVLSVMISEWDRLAAIFDLDACLGPALDEFRRLRPVLREDRPANPR